MSESTDKFPQLVEKNCPADPFQLFDDWFAAASAGPARYPNAMNLATVDPAGNPDSRIVLLKSFSPAGFVFYTNTESAKGRQLAARPQAALTFYWDDLMRQVRIQGKAEPVSQSDADQYFATRPRSAQLGAHASQQSRPLTDRKLLADRLGDFTKQYDGKDVPRPRYWSGYRVIAERFEFWQERASRLHDRIVYSKPHGVWQMERLYP